MWLYCTQGTNDAKAMFVLYFYDRAFHRHNAGHDIDDPLWVNDNFILEVFIAKILHTS